MIADIHFHEDAQKEFNVYSVVQDQVRALAVAHDRRRPFFWRDRR